MTEFLSSVSWVGWLLICLAGVGITQVPHLLRNVWTGERDREKLRAARAAGETDESVLPPTQDGPHQ